MNRVEDASNKLRAAITAASERLVDREVLVELAALCAVAREHLLVIGPPGTAKSVAVRRIAHASGGRYFEYLLGRFTEPSEIFGPVDLRKLREGSVETNVQGMLPEAEIAFLDEIFQGSTAILNTLLGILNERVFRRGHTELRCPLRICVGAANALPEDESLAAFADRFLARVFVDAIDDPQLETLLESGWELDRSEMPALASLADVDALASAARQFDMSSVRVRLAEMLRLLRNAGIVLSDRRAVRAQNLIAAAAAVAGRETPAEADLWPLLYVVPTREQQQVARDVLRKALEGSESSAFPAAAEAASAGPLVRARRLTAAANSLLENPPKEDVATWRLRLEGVAREINASFDTSSMPAELAAVRSRIVRELQPVAAEKSV